jgi:trigger factor
VEQLIDSVDFPLPESPVQEEVDAREHEIVHTLNHDDALYERYLAAQGTTREEHTADLREAAEKAVRAQFVLDAIADSTSVEVGDAELTEYLVRQASRYQMAPQEFATQVMQSGNLPALVADVRRNKALATLLESAVVTDASGNSVDLSALGSESLATLASGTDEDDEPDVDE